MQKTCPSVRSHDSSRRCSTHNGSSPTTSTTFSVASRKMVRHCSLPAPGEPSELTPSPRTPLGSGAVYSFDPVGSYEREACRAAGAAQALVQPFLDNQVCRGRPPSVDGGPSDPYPSLRPSPPADILQEPAATGRLVTSRTPPASGRPVYRHRLLHRRNGAPHRGAFACCCTFASERIADAHG